MFKVSEYDYTRFMDEAEYNYGTKTWTLPGWLFKGIQEDYLLQFSSKYEAHQYVYEYLLNGQYDLKQVGSQS